MTQPAAVRRVDPEALELPEGFRADVVVDGLTLPSGVAFGPAGEIFIAERGILQGDYYGPPRVLRLDPQRELHEIGVLDGPVADILCNEQDLYIAEDGVNARIFRVRGEEVSVIVDNLPGGGDYGLSGLTLDHQGNLAFGIGTRTNSGIVGADNIERGWPLDHPGLADVPGVDISVSGAAYLTTIRGAGLAAGPTGGFQPYGSSLPAGERVKGEDLCSGALYRWDPQTGRVSRAAWGLRNIVGLCLGPANTLYATEGGMEPRGSRPVAGVPDALWEIKSGSFYGWPDNAAGQPVSAYAGRGLGPQPELIRGGPQASTPPAATWPAGAGVGRPSYCASRDIGLSGEFLVPLSGPWFPTPGAEEREPCIVAFDIDSGKQNLFIRNRGGGANPAGLVRPIEVVFDPGGEVLYLLDMGIVDVDADGRLRAVGRTGVLWRISVIDGGDEEDEDSSSSGAGRRERILTAPADPDAPDPFAGEDDDLAGDEEAPEELLGEPVSSGELELSQETGHTPETSEEVPVEHITPEPPPSSLDEVLGAMETDPDQAADQEMESNQA